MEDLANTLVLGVIRIYKWIHWLLLCCVPRSWIRRIMLKAVIHKAGIVVNGELPWDIQVLDERLYARLAQNRSLGLGEAYMDGWWECDDLEELFNKLVSAETYNSLMLPWVRFFDYLQYQVLNRQTRARSFQSSQQHFDMDHAIFEAWLGPSMIHSCGYWSNSENLIEAQIHKMDLIAKKLKLEPGMRVLDLGCGWGGLCEFLAVNYKVVMVGITNSTEGAKSATKRCQGLLVDIRLGDYRDFEDKFDRIVVVEMLENVGHRNYREFFQIIHTSLKTPGLFLLHTNICESDTVPRTDAWQDYYMFPNICIPRPLDIVQNINGLFTIQDWHNLGGDYQKTFRAYGANFTQSWPKIRHLTKTGDQDEGKIFRMWMYHFQSCAGMYKSGKLQVIQTVLTKNSFPIDYVAVR